MAGPWEQYQTQPTAPEAGPWTAYAGQAQQGQGEHGYAAAPPEPPAPPPSALSDLAGRMVQGTMPGLAIQGAGAAYDAVTASPAPPEKKTPRTEDNPAFAARDPREASPPTTQDAGKNGGAMALFWRATTEIITPEARAHPLMQGFLGTQVYGPALSAVGGVLGAGNALMYGGAELTNQVTGDPRAGRDALMMAQVAPGPKGNFAGPRAFAAPMVAPRVAPLMETFNRMDAARAAETAPPDRSWPLRFGDESPAGTSGPAPPPEPPPVSPAAPGSAPGAAPGPAPLSTVAQYVDDYIAGKGRDDPRYEQFAANNAPEIEAEFQRRAGAATAPEPPPIPPKESEPPPIQPRPSEAPQPVGAQITPSAELGLTPQEEATYRSTAEGEKLLEPQEPGIRDDKQYLTGERINEAQASQDVEVARELKSLREQTPELDKIMTADETHNNNIRANAINNAIPGQVQIGAAKKARTDAMAAAEPQVFGNATDADVAPIVKGIQDILNDPKNLENSQLRQYVRPLIDRLQNADGTPKITNPLQLWGWRQDVQHLTSGAAQASDPNLSRVSGMLGKVLDITDDRLEAAAPGYKAKLRDDYRERSREIDAMVALNAERFLLFDSQNKPIYNAVQG